MKRTTFNCYSTITTVGLGFAVAVLTGCATVSDSKLSRYEEAERIGNAHLATFDTLDFEIYTHQKWDRLKESHTEDILVYYPDGHTTKGLGPHIEALKPMFVFAPDTRIEVHPVRIASGEWTSVIGVLEGTFTQPMPTSDGKNHSADGQKVQTQYVHG